MTAAAAGAPTAAQSRLSRLAHAPTKPELDNPIPAWRDLILGPTTSDWQLRNNSILPAIGPKQDPKPTTSSHHLRVRRYFGCLVLFAYLLPGFGEPRRLRPPTHLAIALVYTQPLVFSWL
uniref:Uncharacterized protein n=1 Tax=Bionectria ochroleuca TaxID=29856 RepID=A0A8H7N5A3_BIOOC